jgi:hypothetical protein
MYVRFLTNTGHKRRFTVRVAPSRGWEVRDEFDATVLKAISYVDWHRVERAKAMFALEADHLKGLGWVEP